MASKHATHAIEHFFFKDGATRALFRWLDFRLFVSQQNIQLTSSKDTTAQSATDYLHAWQQQASLTTPATGILRLFSVIAMNYLSYRGRHENVHL